VPGIVNGLFPPLEQLSKPTAWIERGIRLPERAKHHLGPREVEGDDPTRLAFALACAVPEISDVGRHPWGCGGGDVEHLVAVVPAGCDRLGEMVGDRKELAIGRGASTLRDFNEDEPPICGILQLDVRLPPR
jgi:hypothetical protein